MTIAIARPDCREVDKAVKAGCNPTGQPRCKCPATLQVQGPWQNLSDRLCLPGLPGRGQRTNFGDGHQWIGYPRHGPRGPRIGHQSGGGDENDQKKAAQVVCLHPAHPEAARKRDAKRPGSITGRVETDEFRSFVQNKKRQRWTWRVPDHDTGQIVAFALGRRSGAAFGRLKKRLEQAGIKVKKWLCDGRGSRMRCLTAKHRRTGKDMTWRIERENPDFRTRTKRLQRRTICFSKTALMHGTTDAWYTGCLFYQCRFLEPVNYSIALPLFFIYGFQILVCYWQHLRIKHITGGAVFNGVGQFINQYIYHGS